MGDTDYEFDTARFDNKESTAMNMKCFKASNLDRIYRIKRAQSLERKTDAQSPATAKTKRL